MFGIVISVCASLHRPCPLRGQSLGPFAREPIYWAVACNPILHQYLC